MSSEVSDAGPESKHHATCLASATGAFTQLAGKRVPRVEAPVVQPTGLAFLDLDLTPMHVSQSCSVQVRFLGASVCVRVCVCPSCLLLSVMLTIFFFATPSSFQLQSNRRARHSSSSLLTNFFSFSTFLILLFAFRS